MKIKIISFETPSKIFQLASEGRSDNAGNPSGVGQFHIRIEDGIEVVKYLRAKFSTPIDRGNKLTTVTFAVDRKWTSQPQADAFMLDVATNMPTSGRVEFETVEGTKRMLRWFTSAVINVVDSHNTGVSTFHSLTVIGGQLYSK